LPDKGSTTGCGLGWFTAFLKQLRRLTFNSALSQGGSVSPDAVAKVQHEQLKLLSLSLHLFALVGTSSIALLALDFWSNLTVGSSLCVVAIPCLYGFLLGTSFRWRNGGSDPTFLRRSLLGLLFLGLCWGGFVNLLAYGANPSQKALLDAIMIALISCPLVTAPFSAAVAFWAPCAVAGIGVICQALHIDVYLMLCYLGYANFTFAAMFMANRFLLERSTGRILLEQQNETIKVFLQDYEESGSDWIWETDAELRLIHVSSRFSNIARRSSAHLEGVSLLFLLKLHTDPEAQLLRKMLDERTPFRNITIPVEIDGDVRCWTLTGRPVAGQNAVFAGYRGIGADITDVRRYQERVRHLALHDSLTGLANRQSFMDALHATLDRKTDGSITTSSRSLVDGLTNGALMLLDLDRFKSVNDTHGHAIGDELLIAVAQRLRSVIREGNIAARLGGDEFGLLVAVRRPEEAQAVAQRVIDTLAQEYLIAGVRHDIGVSIGIAFATVKDPSAYTMRCADVALYAAKNAGRGCYRVFLPDMIREQHHRNELQADLRNAIRSNSLRLVFQPIFDVLERKIISVEALCRWRHPALGDIDPSLFIPMAEKIGMIAELGGWALNCACMTATTWPSTVRLAVNVSTLQITSSDFKTTVSNALQSSGLVAGRLELELTESAYMEATEHTVSALQSIRSGGSQIILDDFCTGQSSLTYLTSFKCDGLKIDRSFVQNLDTDPTKAAVVRAISQLAEDLNIPVTAEGVETRLQLDTLAEFGVTHIQGYLLSRPVETDVLLDMLTLQAAAA